MRTGDLVTRAEYCVIAVAECFRGDGEIMANPIGTVPMIGGRLARASFSPDLVMTDGEALLVSGPYPVGATDQAKTIEAWNPYRSMFDVVWSGRRHVMMGASQIDAFGNQNFAFVGDWAAPKAQLLGFRGAPGNTIQNTTSYWIPNHSARVFVPKVDVVTGVGYDRAAAARRGGPLPPAAPRGHQPRRPRLRDRRPPHAPALGAPGRDGGRHRRARPASSSPCPPTSPRRAPRHPTSSRSSAR